MDKKEFVIGLSITICSLILMWIQSGVKTCMGSGVGCQSGDELFYAALPDIIFFVFFIIGIWIMKDSLDI